MEENKIELSGKINGNVTVNHEYMGEIFYKTFIDVCRDSNTVDTLPLLISSKLLLNPDDIKNKHIWISGNIRTYNKEDHSGTHLMLYVFVDCIDLLENEDSKDINDVQINGYICKKPTYRKTPNGREISDLHIAINRLYGKSDYIPCISWGRNARYSSALSVGDKVSIIGRLQSRQFIKHIDDDIYSKVTYELSIQNINLINE